MQVSFLQLADGLRIRVCFSGYAGRRLRLDRS